MFLKPFNLGACGVKQVFHAGRIFFSTDGISDGVEIAELPENIIVTGATVVVNKAFNAATTNTITVGTEDAADGLLASTDITAGTVGAYSKTMFKIYKRDPVKIVAKYAQTGTAATAGEADIYLEVVRIPE